MYAIPTYWVRKIFILEKEILPTKDLTQRSQSAQRLNIFPSVLCAYLVSFVLKKLGEFSKKIAS